MVGSAGRQGIADEWREREPRPRRGGEWHGVARRDCSVQTGRGGAIRVQLGRMDVVAVTGKGDGRGIGGVRVVMRGEDIGPKSSDALYRWMTDDVRRSLGKGSGLKGPSERGHIIGRDGEK